MATNHPKSGPSYVPAYQVSGIPFVTSSVASEVPGPDSNSLSEPVSVKFPYVTKFITIRNTGVNELRVGFSADGMISVGERRANVNEDKPAGTTSNFFLIPTGSGNQGHPSIQTFDVRCKEIFFLSNATKASDPTTAGNSTSFSLLAGLTTIESSQFPVLTGSNGFEGVG